MTIAIISGSHRPHGESGRIACWLKGRLAEDGKEAFVLDLAEANFPMWDEGLWGVDGLKDKWSDIWQPWADKLADAEGYIFLAPEYAGMVPPMLKNFFLIAGSNLFNHKPAVLVGVSGSKNGVYPIAELRMSSSKNNKLCYTPDHLIIRNAAEVLKADVKADFVDEDAYLQDRITYTLEIFYEYVKALKAVRTSGKIETEKYTFGM